MITGASQFSRQQINWSASFVSSPAAEPVTLVNAKLWCRVDEDITDQDGMINLVIAAARERAELLTGQAFVRRDALLVMDDLPWNGEAISLPFAPLASVAYVRYKDGSGTHELSGSPDAFLVDTSSKVGRIAPINGWPATDGTISNVQIRYTCGYAPGSGSPTDYAENIPSLVKLWMQQRVVTYYDNRAAIDMTNIGSLARDYVDGLLDGLRVDFGMA